LRREEDFVGVGIADAAEQAWIAKGAFQSVIGRRENFREARKVGIKHFQSTGIKGAKIGFSGHDVKRGAFLGSGFSPEKCSVGKVESRQASRSRNFSSRGTPVQPACDHEMQDKPQIFFEADADALAHAPQVKNSFAFRIA
jgi:hypothetical protein